VSLWITPSCTPPEDFALLRSNKNPTKSIVRESTNQPKTPLFAEVNIRNEESGTEKKKRRGGPRLPYFKLTYPNGVSLTLPADIGTEQLERFVRLTV
jgi:hypothetical protein